MLFRSAKVLSAEYQWPFQSHASMGPACAVADVRADGATVWSGTQKPHFAAQGVAKMLNLPPDKVHVVWMYGPGAYGRNDAGDALMDAAVISQAIGKPVRVQYMRHEGTGWDPKGPASIHRVRAALDSSGKVTAWDFLSRGFSRYEVAQVENDPGETLVGQMLGAKPQLAPAFAISEDTYTFDNKRVAWDTIPPLLEKVSPLRSAHVRDPMGPQCHFASECFMDDIAAATNADPVAHRLNYLREERDIAVIKAAAEKAGWKAGPLGTRRGKDGNLLTGQGIAYTRREALGTTTYVCVVSDVAVDPATGRVVLGGRAGRSGLGPSARSSAAASTPSPVEATPPSESSEADAPADPAPVSAPPTSSTASVAPPATSADPAAVVAVWSSGVLASLKGQIGRAHV